MAFHNKTSTFHRLLEQLAEEHGALQRRHDELLASSAPPQSAHLESQVVPEHLHDALGASCSGKIGADGVAACQAAMLSAPPALDAPLQDVSALPFSPSFPPNPPKPPRVPLLHVSTRSTSAPDLTEKEQGVSASLSWQEFAVEAADDEQDARHPNIGGDSRNSTNNNNNNNEVRGYDRRRWFLTQDSRMNTDLSLAEGAQGRSATWSSGKWFEGEAMLDNMTVSMTIWPEWIGLVNKDGQTTIPQGEDDASIPHLLRGRSQTRSREPLSSSSRRSICDRLVLEPRCSRKALWNLIGLLCLCCDFIIIPLFVFDIHEHPAVIGCSIFICSFWSLDVICTLFTGFYDKELEMHAFTIWKRYAKTWLVPDMTLVAIDWVTIYMYDRPGALSGYSQFGRTSRTVRLLRTIRLLRIIKGSHMFEELTITIRSELLQITMTISKMVWGVAMLNHIIACAWYALAQLDVEKDTDWVTVFSTRGASKDELDDYFAYFSALHWSLAQCTLATTEVVPTNVYERIFAIITVLLALVVFSSFMSSIATAMAHLRSVRSLQTKTQASFRKYASQNKLSQELSLHVQRFASVHHQRSTHVLMSDLQFVRYLPESLRIQLHSEVYLPRLKSHPLFYYWSRFDVAGITKICYTAMTEWALRAGEELFTYGDQCSQMYFALEGDLEYHHLTSDGDDVTDIMGNRRDPKRISEIVLWMPWEHRGRIVANNSSFLLTLDSAKFRSIANGRRAIVGPASLYAGAYISELLKACDGRKELLLDVWAEGDLSNQIASSAYTQSGMDVTGSMDHYSSYHSNRRASVFDGMNSLRTLFAGGKTT